MSIAYVYHLIHVRTPHEHHPKLFITDVPTDISVDDVKEAIECWRGDYREFSAAWSNFVVDIGLRHAPNGVKAGWRRGDIATISWEDLTQDDLPN